MLHGTDKMKRKKVERIDYDIDSKLKNEKGK